MWTSLSDPAQKCGINVSLSLYVLDCVILAIQLIASSAEAVLYGILLIVTYTLVLDKVLMAGMTKMQVKIVVSRRHEQINALISQRLDCGTSLLHMETGYLHRGTGYGAGCDFQAGSAKAEPAGAG